MAGSLGSFMRGQGTFRAGCAPSDGETVRRENVRILVSASVLQPEGGAYETRPCKMAYRVSSAFVFIPVFSRIRAR